MKDYQWDLFSIVFSLYAIVGGMIALLNFVYELPYSKWAYNNLSSWGASAIVSLCGICLLIGAIPPKRRGRVANYLFILVTVTMFLFLRASYALAPGFIKLFCFVTFIAHFVIRGAVGKGEKAK